MSESELASRSSGGLEVSGISRVTIGSGDGESIGSRRSIGSQKSIGDPRSIGGREGSICGVQSISVPQSIGSASVRQSIGGPHSIDYGVTVPGMRRLFLPKKHILVTKNKCLPSGDCLPLWKELPLDQKLPCYRVPEGALELTTRRLSQKPYENRSRIGFDLTDPNNYCINNEYNSLTDPHLRRFYRSGRVKKRLLKNGEVTLDDQVKCTLKDFNKYRGWIKHIGLLELHKRQEEERKKESILKNLQAVESLDIAGIEARMHQEKVRQRQLKHNEATLIRRRSQLFELERRIEQTRQQREERRAPDDGLLMKKREHRMIVYQKANRMQQQLANQKLRNYKRKLRRHEEYLNHVEETKFADKSQIIREDWERRKTFQEMLQMEIKMSYKEKEERAHRYRQLFTVEMKKRWQAQADAVKVRSDKRRQRKMNYEDDNALSIAQAFAYSPRINQHPSLSGPSSKKTQSGESDSSLLASIVFTEAKDYCQSSQASPREEGEPQTPGEEEEAGEETPIAVPSFTSIFFKRRWRVGEKSSDLTVLEPLDEMGLNIKLHPLRDTKSAEELEKIRKALTKIYKRVSGRSVCWLPGMKRPKKKGDDTDVTETYSSSGTDEDSDDIEMEKSNPKLLLWQSMTLREREELELCLQRLLDDLNEGRLDQNDLIKLAACCSFLTDTHLTDQGTSTTTLLPTGASSTTAGERETGGHLSTESDVSVSSDDLDKFVEEALEEAMREEERKEEDYCSRLVDDTIRRTVSRLTRDLNDGSLSRGDVRDIGSAVASAVVGEVRSEESCLAEEFLVPTLKQLLNDVDSIDDDFLDRTLASLMLGYHKVTRRLDKLVWQVIKDFAVEILLRTKVALVHGGTDCVEFLEKMEACKTTVLHHEMDLPRSNELVQVLTTGTVKLDGVNELCPVVCDVMKIVLDKGKPLLIARDGWEAFPLPDIDSVSLEKVGETACGLEVALEVTATVADGLFRDMLGDAKFEETLRLSLAPSLFLVVLAAWGEMTAALPKDTVALHTLPKHLDYYPTLGEYVVLMACERLFTEASQNRLPQVLIWQLALHVAEFPSLVPLSQVLDPDEKARVKIPPYVLRKINALSAMVQNGELSLDQMEKLLALLLHIYLREVLLPQGNVSVPQGTTTRKPEPDQSPPQQQEQQQQQQKLQPGRQSPRQSRIVSRRKTEEDDDEDFEAAFPPVVKIEEEEESRSAVTSFVRTLFTSLLHHVKNQVVMKLDTAVPDESQDVGVPLEVIELMAVRGLSRVKTVLNKGLTPAIRQDTQLTHLAAISSLRESPAEQAKEVSVKGFLKHMMRAVERDPPCFHEGLIDKNEFHAVHLLFRKQLGKMAYHVIKHFPSLSVIHKLAVERSPQGSKMATFLVSLLLELRNALNDGVLSAGVITDFLQHVGCELCPVGFRGNNQQLSLVILDIVNDIGWRRSRSKYFCRLVKRLSQLSLEPSAERTVVAEGMAATADMLSSANTEILNQFVQTTLLSLLHSIRGSHTRLRYHTPSTDGALAADIRESGTSDDTSNRHMPPQSSIDSCTDSPRTNPLQTMPIVAGDAGGAKRDSPMGSKPPAAAAAAAAKSDSPPETTVKNVADVRTAENEECKLAEAVVGKAVLAAQKRLSEEFLAVQENVDEKATADRMEEDFRDPQVGTECESPPDREPLEVRKEEAVLEEAKADEVRAGSSSPSRNGAKTSGHKIPHHLGCPDNRHMSTCVGTKDSNDGDEEFLVLDKKSQMEIVHETNILARVAIQATLERLGLVAMDSQESDTLGSPTGGGAAAVTGSAGGVSRGAAPSIPSFQVTEIVSSFVDRFDKVSDEAKPDREFADLNPVIVPYAQELMQHVTEKYMSTEEQATADADDRASIRLGTENMASIIISSTLKSVETGLASNRTDSTSSMLSSPILGVPDYISNTLEAVHSELDLLHANATFSVSERLSLGESLSSSGEPCHTLRRARQIVHFLLQRMTKFQSPVSNIKSQAVPDSEGSSTGGKKASLTTGVTGAILQAFEDVLRNMQDQNKFFNHQDLEKLLSDEGGAEPFSSKGAGRVMVPSLPFLMDEYILSHLQQLARHLTQQVPGMESRAEMMSTETHSVATNFHVVVKDILANLRSTVKEEDEGDAAGKQFVLTILDKAVTRVLEDSICVTTDNLHAIEETEEACSRKGSSEAVENAGRTNVEVKYDLNKLLVSLGNMRTVSEQRLVCTEDVRAEQQLVSNSIQQILTSLQENQVSIVALDDLCRTLLPQAPVDESKDIKVASLVTELQSIKSSVQSGNISRTKLAQTAADINVLTKRRVDDPRLVAGAIKRVSSATKSSSAQCLKTALQDLLLGLNDSRKPSEPTNAQEGGEVEEPTKAREDETVPRQQQTSCSKAAGGNEDEVLPRQEGASVTNRTEAMETSCGRGESTESAGDTGMPLRNIMSRTISKTAVNEGSWNRERKPSFIYSTCVPVRRGSLSSEEVQQRTSESRRRSRGVESPRISFEALTVVTDGFVAKQDPDTVTSDTVQPATDTTPGFQSDGGKGTTSDMPNAPPVSEIPDLGVKDSGPLPVLHEATTDTMESVTIGERTGSVEVAEEGEGKKKEEGEEKGKEEEEGENQVRRTPSNTSKKSGSKGSLENEDWNRSAIRVRSENFVSFTDDTYETSRQDSEDAFEPYGAQEDFERMTKRKNSFKSPKNPKSNNCGRALLIKSEAFAVATYSQGLRKGPRPNKTKASSGQPKNSYHKVSDLDTEPTTAVQEYGNQPNVQTLSKGTELPGSSQGIPSDFNDSAPSSQVLTENGATGLKGHISQNVNGQMLSKQPDRSRAAKKSLKQGAVPSRTKSSSSSNQTSLQQQEARMLQAQIKAFSLGFSMFNSAEKEKWSERPRKKDRQRHNQSVQASAYNSWPCIPCPPCPPPLPLFAVRHSSTQSSHSAASDPRRMDRSVSSNRKDAKSMAASCQSLFMPHPPLSLDLHPTERSWYDSQARKAVPRRRADEVRNEPDRKPDREQAAVTAHDSSAPYSALPPDQKRPREKRQVTIHVPNTKPCPGSPKLSRSRQAGFLRKLMEWNTESSATPSKTNDLKSGHDVRRPNAVSVPTSRNTDSEQSLAGMQSQNDGRYPAVTESRSGVSDVSSAKSMPAVPSYYQRFSCRHRLPDTRHKQPNITAKLPVLSHQSPSSVPVGTPPPANQQTHEVPSPSASHSLHHKEKDEQVRRTQRSQKNYDSASANISSSESRARSCWGSQPDEGGPSMTPHAPNSERTSQMPSRRRLRLLLADNMQMPKPPGSEKPNSKKRQ